MISKLQLCIAGAAASFALASCGGGGGGASSAVVSLEPPTDLLAWNYGRATQHHWFNNTALLPADAEDPPFNADTDGLRNNESNGNFYPRGTQEGRNVGLSPPILNAVIDPPRRDAEGSLLRDGFASWGDPVNEIPFLLATESDADYLRQSNTYFDHFNFEDGVSRSIMANGRYSAILLHGTWLCREAECQSSGVRGFLWGKKSWLPEGGDSGWSWMQRSGASATWRGAMAANTVASGVAVVGEAAITYTVGNDSVGVQLTNIEQRADGTGVIDSTYSGPTSFSWTNLRGQDNSVSEYWKYSGQDPDYDGEPFGVYARFYGPNSEEVAGGFDISYSDAEIDGGKDKLVGGYVAKR